MTLGELEDIVRATSPEPAAQQLASLLRSWKDDDTTVEALREQVERFIGNAWIEREEHHNAICAAWSAFVGSTIASVKGMTMNERLYLFGLERRFEEAPDEQKSMLYAKVLARP